MGLIFWSLFECHGDGQISTEAHLYLLSSRSSPLGLFNGMPYLKGPYPRGLIHLLKMGVIPGATFQEIPFARETLIKWGIIWKDAFRRVPYSMDFKWECLIRGDLIQGGGAYYTIQRPHSKGTYLRKGALFEGAVFEGALLEGNHIIGRPYTREGFSEMSFIIAGACSKETSFDRDSFKGILIRGSFIRGGLNSREPYSN